MKEKEKPIKKPDERMVAGGLFVTAGILLGMGIGWALNHMLSGMFIGLGAGFLVFAIIIILKRK